MMSAARQPEIDSRQYRFSYLIRSLEDVPADFPIPEPERLRIGLFLPRDRPTGLDGVHIRRAFFYWGRMRLWY
jgi:hypothetical protein